MNEDAPTMSVGTGGFSGSANAKGPVAGFDPVMKFRGKIKKKKQIKETTTCPRDSQVPSRLFLCVSEKTLDDLGSFFVRGLNNLNLE